MRYFVMTGDKMASETVGYLLLNDSKGTKFDGMAKSALKKIIPGSTPHSSVNVLRGELLLGMKLESYQFNYMLHNNSSICLFCDETNMAPLNSEEFLLLEAIKQPGDRLDAFNKKLEWGVKVKPGHVVYISIPGAGLSVRDSARAAVHYKGQIAKQPGIYFGIEIMVRIVILKYPDEYHF
jgi:hypothetical protein